jgi:membrane protease YdiL (CAAX protease family)
MTAALQTQLCIALIVFLGMLLVRGRRLFLQPRLLVLFFTMYFADNLLIVLSNHFPDLQLISNQVWEGFLTCSWSGKLYSILFTLALLYTARKLLSADELGLTLHQKAGSLLPASLVTLALAGWAAWIGLRSPKGEFDGGVLAYLALMPGLNEELVYRGGLLGILNRLMPARMDLLGAWLGWGAVFTSFLFSLLHGFWLDSRLALHIDAIALCNSFFTGFAFAWLRERTSSLLMPMLAHGLVDFLFFLPRML